MSLIFIYLLNKSFRKFITTMKKYLENINFKELFFPVISDLNSINEEINVSFISNNNWDLANDEVEFKRVLAKIKESKKTEEPSETNNYVIL